MPEEKSKESISHVNEGMPKSHDGNFGGNHSEASKDHTKGYSVSRDTAGHIERTEVVKKT